MRAKTARLTRATSDFGRGGLDEVRARLRGDIRQDWEHTRGLEANSEGEGNLRSCLVVMGVGGLRLVGVKDNAYEWQRRMVA